MGDRLGRDGQYQSMPTMPMTGIAPNSTTGSTAPKSSHQGNPGRFCEAFGQALPFDRPCDASVAINPLQTWQG